MDCQLSFVIEFRNEYARGIAPPPSVIYNYNSLNYIYWQLANKTLPIVIRLVRLQELFANWVLILSEINDYRIHRWAVALQRLFTSEYIEIYNFLELFHTDVFCIQKEQYDADWIAVFISNSIFLDTFTAISFSHDAFKCSNYSIIMALCAISNGFISNSICCGGHIHQTTKKYYGQLRESKNISNGSRAVVWSNRYSGIEYSSKKNKSTHWCVSV